MKQTVCVLGGSGFVGRRVLIKLAQAGYEMKVITRHKNRNMALLNYANVTVIEANIFNHPNLEELFSGCGVLINLIGVLNNGKGQSSYRNAHVEIVRKILAVVNNTELNRLIHISASNADSSLASSGYLQSKGEAENILKVQTNNQVAVTVLRPSAIFGKDGGFVKTFGDLLRRHKFLPLPCARSKICPIFVDDVANAITQCIDNQATYGKTYDLCGKDIYTLTEAVSIIDEMQMSNTKIIPLADFSSKIVAKVLGHLPGKKFTSDNYAILHFDEKRAETIEFIPDYNLKPYRVWAKEALQISQVKSKYYSYRQQVNR